MTTRSGLSFAHIDRNDLLRLAKLAADTEAGLFARHPQGANIFHVRDGRISEVWELHDDPASNAWLWA